MRSIGKKNIDLVKLTCKEAILEGVPFMNLNSTVRERLPQKLWDIWEGADAEIDAIIEDVIWESEK